MSLWQRNLITAVCGLVGMGLALVGWHLWDDHRFVDRIRAANAQQIAAQAQQIERFQQQQKAVQGP